MYNRNNTNRSQSVTMEVRDKDSNNIHSSNRFQKKSDFTQVHSNRSTRCTSIQTTSLGSIYTTYINRNNFTWIDLHDAHQSKQLHLDRFAVCKSIQTTFPELK